MNGQQRRCVTKRTAVLICAALLGGGIARGAAIDRGTAGGAAVVKAAFNRTLKKTIVADGRGITLYAFSVDASGKPSCYVDPGYKCVKSWPSCVHDPEYNCAKLWPPLTTVGRPMVGKGLDPKLVGTARRRDGRLQVTYNHHPLYYYAGGLGPPADTRPGDANGQAFGGLWWAVAPSGKEIK
jgi:predicted lipoprotein with Yx(FWY)xxD motif